MTKQTGNIDVSSFTTDAKFRTFGSAVSTALQATPLVKTSDTGQINWSTVTKATAINTKQGYEIYRFSDTLQATKPVFLRIDYGSGGTASGNQPCVWVNVGTATDGAGNLTGITTGSIQGSSVALTTNNVAMTYYFTFNSNGTAVLFFGTGLSSGVQGSPGMFTVSRTVNQTTGAATGDGVILSGFYVGAGLHKVYGLDFNTTSAFTTGRPLAVGFINTNYSIATASSEPVSKAYCMLSTLAACDAYVGVYGPDVSDLSTFTASPWGTSHTYLVIKVHLVSFEPSTSISACVGAILWED